MQVTDEEADTLHPSHRVRKQHDHAEKSLLQCSPRKVKKSHFSHAYASAGFLQSFPVWAVLAGTQLQRSQEGYPASSRGEGVGGDRDEAGWIPTGFALWKPWAAISQPSRVLFNPFLAAEQESEQTSEQQTHTGVQHIAYSTQHTYTQPQGKTGKNLKKQTITFFQYFSRGASFLCASINGCCNQTCCSQAYSLKGGGKSVTIQLCTCPGLVTSRNAIIVLQPGSQRWTGITIVHWLPGAF